VISGSVLVTGKWNSKNLWKWWPCDHIQHAWGQQLSLADKDEIKLWHWSAR
jgi:hypothetical protein